MLKRKISFFALALSCAMVGTSSSSFAQGKKKDNEKPAAPVTAPAADSAKKDAPVKLKKYEDVITKGTTSVQGFLTVHKKEDKYYFEIPFSLFKREIMAVNRISKASVDMRNGMWGLAGDQIGESVYAFERAAGNKLFLRQLSYTEYVTDSTSELATAITNNNVQAIVSAFPIVAFNHDSTTAVIDVTEFLNSDNNVLYFENAALKQRAGMGAQQNDRSYIDYVHAYPTNLEVKAVKTYAAGINPAHPFYTVELNASLLLLPEKRMQPRIMDERVGYFTSTHRDFEAEPQGVRNTSYARRWRLEPKPEDEQRYLKGELVEPKQPIVFYIDPATPKKWVPYLIAGINDWNKAFEHAGFKNAIIGKEAPTKEQDSTWSLDDARHSAIIYRPSVIPNAMGPNVADPRSGEILESHIFWYHNVMQLLQKWYLVQCGATDPRATKPVIDDQLMGELIRFVSSHEVGHTLGLRHNFGASYNTPVEKLRDKNWLKEHGHTTSIMDYARFNYVAQPEDNVGTEGLYPRINDYDKWAIEWGYRWRPSYKNEWEEQKALSNIVSDSLLKNPRLTFGGEMEVFDPRAQNEDLGDDAMKASEYGIRNLKRIVPQLVTWTRIPAADYQELGETFKEVFGQYSRYLGHVMKNVGGIYHELKLSTDAGPVYTYVEYDKQKRAVKFLSDNLFTTPEWLNNREIFTRLPYSFGEEFGKLQQDALEVLITRRRMSVLMNTKLESKEKAYSLDEMFSDLDRYIFTELYSGKNVDFYRRNLQKAYVSRLIQQAFAQENPGEIAVMSYKFYMSDMQGIMRDELKKLQQLCKKALANPATDKDTKIHCQELVAKIDLNFKNKN
ncbi:zinc-dependent metalloprotease [Chitinophaga sp. Cy-1792]|uniref:zinc-dependent metalloprotease n=1 Tax=Chitinophaga sp. Cy-1792 TaxID=2608339 RepID=UPI00142400D5|nr:zinc-dependent metalloprotease [Chitinophaga sp. Cy-1792]NIG57536.1 zinc-dependent metalloprotease [Chitinophaga sp. Cy-1792]